MKHTIELLSHLQQGSLVITPNNRLAHQLLQAYDRRYKPTSGALAKPLCFPYQTFLQYLFQQLEYQETKETHPLLLNTTQQRHLWRTVAATNDHPLSESMLDLIQEAWKNGCDSNCDFDDPAFSHALQYQRFQKWHHNFLQRLATHQAITIEQLPVYLMNQSLALKPTTLIWTCFDDFTPLQQDLQTWLNAQGCLQCFDDLQPQAGVTLQLAARDQSAEYDHMLNWVETRLHAGDATIALVVPDLQSQASGLQRLLMQRFSETQFNLSLGTPVNTMPIVGTALQWLQLTPQTGTLSSHQVRLLLQSPFIHGSQSEHLARAQLLQDSMMMKESMVSWATLTQVLSHSTPQLFECLQQLSHYPQTDTPHGWSRHFKERLTRLGFPGEYPLNSENYQYVHRFMRLFDELMSLSALTTHISQQEAINIIITLSQTTVFQIKKPMSSIMILGMLEASGCTFDSMWISGLTHHCLPQKTRFSPLIPIGLQKKHQFPHTAPSKELRWAKHLLKRFEYACDQLIFSYPALINDIPQLPCSFIRHFPLLETAPSATNAFAVALESYDESYRLPPRTDETLSGGTALLASQAKCPFQAFAAYRLQASATPEASEGPDAMERGQLIHKVMESVWRELGRQAKLLTIAPVALEALIEDSIHTAFKPLLQARPQSFPWLVQDVEKERLRQLVHANLAWEKQREPFEISALEQQYTLTLASIPFKVRIDRIDTVVSEHNRTQVVIDYKSSLPPHKPWLEERPEAPQLLLYALLDPQITALLFIQLKTGRITTSGISDPSTPLPDVLPLKPEEHWSDYQQRWKQQLTDIAEEIQSGRCDPAPNRISHCGTCYFQALCRM